MAKNLSELIHNPHDGFFKYLFKHKQNVIDFIDTFLSESVRETIDPGTLELVESGHIDAELKGFRSDVIYRMSVSGGTGYIIFLFEHKSTPERMSALQLLNYCTKIWMHEWLKESRKDLSVIFPVVVYNGRLSWSAPLQLSGLYCCNEKNRKIYTESEYILVNLSGMEEIVIRDNPELEAGLRLLKEVARPDFLNRLRDILRRTNDIDDLNERLSFIRSVVLYATQYLKDFEIIELRDIIKTDINAPGDGGTVMGTIAEMFIEQGVKKGIKQGVKKGIKKGIEKGIKQGIIQGEIRIARSNIIDALEVRFGDVPETIKDRINKIDSLVLLKQLHKKAILADSMETFTEAIDSAEK